MKKIKFLNINSRCNFLVLFILVVAVVANSLMGLEFITFENPQVQKILSVVTYSLIALYLSRIFWYKNVIQYNKNGFTARINSFWGINKKYEDIIKIEVLENKINLTEYNGNISSIDINKIEESSKIQLLEFLNSNIRSI